MGMAPTELPFPGSHGQMGGLLICVDFEMVGIEVLVEV